MLFFGPTRPLSRFIATICFVALMAVCSSATAGVIVSSQQFDESRETSIGLGMDFSEDAEHPELSVKRRGEDFRVTKTSAETTTPIAWFACWVFACPLVDIKCVFLGDTLYEGWKGGISTPPA